MTPLDRFSGSFESSALIVLGCIIGALLVLVIAFLRQWLA